MELREDMVKRLMEDLIESVKKIEKLEKLGEEITAETPKGVAKRLMDDLTKSVKNIEEENDGEDFLSLAKKKLIPDYAPEEIEYFSGFMKRGKYTKECGFAFLSRDWISGLSSWIGDRKCMEVMAGSGALTKVLKEEGVDIFATDNFSWTNPFSNWTEIKNLDAVEAVQQHTNVDIIICSWPPYEDEAMTEVLLEKRRVNPDALIIYIGEDWGGCTASDSFFEVVEFVQDDFFEESVEGYLSWYGIRDSIQLIK